MLMRLRREADRDGAYRVAARLRAVLLNDSGKTSGEISDLLDSPRSCVTDWLQNFQNFGYEGLLEGQRSGRPAQMTKQQTGALADIIDSGPLAYGFLSGVWTSILIAKVIEEEFSITYHPAHVRKILDKIGFSVQRPKKILAKADPQKQDRWRRYTYPNIKKKRKTSEPR
jgi:transposase